MTEWIASNALTLILVSVTAIGAWYTFGARLSNVEKEQELRRSHQREPRCTRLCWPRHGLLLVRVDVQVRATRQRGRDDLGD